MFEGKCLEQKHPTKHKYLAQSLASQKGCESIEKYEPEVEQMSRGLGFKLSRTIKHARNINSQLARGNSFTQSVINSSTSSSSNVLNLFSPDSQCGSNFNQVAFAFQMPSYISGQNDQEHKPFPPMSSHFQHGKHTVWRGQYF